MYNLRYHIASLVAIFLSLSIGLLLGTVVSERGTLDEQRDALTQGLREDFAELRAENDELRKENEARDTFVNDVVPLLVDGTLAGSRTLLLTNAGRADGRTDVEEVVRAAGGELAVVTFAVQDLGLDDALVSELASASVSPSGQQPADRGEVIAALVSEWVTPDAPRPLTDLLVDSGAMSLDEFEPGFAVDRVVVIASWDGVPDETAIEIARAFGARDLIAVGVETSTMETGVATAAVEAGLSAVDDMGVPEADYSLAAVLSGRASGAFGHGDAANRPYPVIRPGE